MLSFNIATNIIRSSALVGLALLILAPSSHAVRFYGSFRDNEDIGSTTFLDEDVLLVEDAIVSVFQATTSFFTQDEDIDALYVELDGSFLFSTSAGATIASGIDGGAGGIASGDVIRYDAIAGTFSQVFDDFGPGVDAIWVANDTTYLSLSEDCLAANGCTVGSNSIDILDDHVFTLTGGSGTDVASYTATVVLDANNFLLDPGEEPDTGTDIDAFAITDDGNYLFSSSSSNSFLIEGGDPEIPADFVRRDGGVVYILDPTDTASFDAREESSIYYDASSLFETSINIDALHFLPADAPVTDADFNGDTMVDIEDYTIWRDTLGATGLTPYDLGDANGDGNVTEADYNAWRSEFGSVAGLSSEPSTVPEPASLVSLVLAATSLAVLGRRRR